MQLLILFSQASQIYVTEIIHLFRTAAIVLSAEPNCKNTLLLNKTWTWGHNCSCFLLWHQGVFWQVITRTDSQSNTKEACRYECNVTLGLCFRSHNLTSITRFILTHSLYTKLWTRNSSSEVIQKRKNHKSPLCFVISSLTKCPKCHNCDTFSICLQTSSKGYFYFLLVNHQLLFESKTNDRRFSPLARHHAGRTAKPGCLTNARPRQAGGKWKTLLLKRARQLSKKQPLASAHQAGAGARPFPRRSGASGRPRHLRWGREAEDCRDEPRTQWCFRAESSRTSQARAQFPAQLSLLALNSAPSST